MSDARLTVAADISALVAEMSKIPGVTSDAALKASVELKKQQDQIARQAEATAKRIQAAAEKASGDMEGKLADGFGAVNKAATVIAPALQGVTGPLDDMGDLIEKVGIKGAAAMVGVGALVAGTVALIANAADVAMRIDEVSAELGASSLLMVAYRDDLEGARDSIESAGFALADMRTELAGRWAGAVENGASIGVSFAAIMGEIGSDVGVATTYIASSVGALIDQQGALSGALSVWVDYGAELQTQARIQREIAEGEREIAAALSVTTRELELQADALLQQQLAALGMVETQEQEQARVERTRDAEREADRAQRERESRARERAREAEKAAADQQRAAEQLYQILQAGRVREMGDLDQIIARRDIEIAKILELADASGNHLTAEEAIQARIRQAEQETADLRAKLAQEEEDRIAKQVADAEKAAAEEKAAAQKAADEAKKANQQQADTNSQAWTDSIGVAQAATDSIIGLLDTQTEGGRRAAHVMFGIQKALALADIAVHTAVASVAALEAGPVAGAVLAGLTVAAGAAAAAAVAAQQPSFHTGLWGATRALASDEVRAVVKAGEVVVPRPMVDRAGGPEAVRDRIEGGGNGGVQVVVDFASRRIVAPLLDLMGRSGPVDPMLGYAHGR